MSRLISSWRHRLATLAFVAALGTGFAGPAALGQTTAAPSPEHLAAARRLMEASGAAKQFDDILPRMLGQIQGHISRRDPAEARMVREVFSRVSERMIRDKGELIDALVQFYAEKLTVAEMDEVMRFYQSAAGSKLLSLTPELAQRTVEISQGWVGKLSGEVQKELEAERKRRREEKQKERQEAPRQ